MLPIINEFISALNSEIEELKKGRGGSTVSIYDGEFVRESANLFIYQFSLENILITMDDTPAEIEINGRNHNCYVVTVSGQNVILSLEENLGNKIPFAKLKTNTWYLLEILKKKYEEFGNDAQKFTQSLKLFSGESKHLNANDDEPKEYGFIDGDNPNESQRKAIKASINKSLCIIWGPPGTGKTRTISKLVEEHLKLGRKVLLVSHSNNAVDEAMIKIGEQLQSSELYQDGKLVRFGVMKEELSKKVREKGLDLIVFDKIAERKSESLIKEKNALTEEFAQLSKKFKQIEEVQTLSNSITQIDSEIIGIKNNLNDKTLSLFNLQNQIKLLLEEQKQLQDQLFKAQRSSAIKRLFLGLNPEIIQKKLDKLSVNLDVKSRQKDTNQDALFKLNSELTKREAQKQDAIKALESELMAVGINIMEVDAKVSELKNKRDAIQSRITEIQKFTDEIQSKILSEARLIGTTLTKTYIAKPIEPLTFDVLIVDEVSMAPQPMLFWAASKASLAVTIVGDFMQLPPISASREAIAQKWLANSIFDTLHINKVQEACKDERINLLDEQYRMHPIISKIPRELYEWKLKDGKPTPLPIRDSISEEVPLVLIDTSLDNPWASQISSGGRFNLYNALLCISLAEKILSLKNGADKISIITPYRNQANLIIKIAKDKGIDRKLRINTIHSFQGAEDKIVIFDTVEGTGAKRWSMLNENNTEDAKKLVNVAVTRAESKLYIIANKSYIFNNFSPDTIMSKILNIILREGMIKPSNQIIQNWRAVNFEKWADELYTSASSKSIEGSKLYSENEFWPTFFDDLKSSKDKVIILSPFLSVKRTSLLLNLLISLIDKKVKIFVLTKPTNEQFGQMVDQAGDVIEKLKQIGIMISFRSKMHQKVAIIDNKIAWEGSLNIFSHNDSEEQMRRIEGEKTIKQICDNLGLDDLDLLQGENQLCPECLSKGIKSFITLKKGKYGYFYACTNPDCDWTVSVKKGAGLARNKESTPKPYGKETTKQSYPQRREWETSICYWSLEKKPGYIYSKKRDAWYKRK
jgi:translation elongation factor EF-1beta